MASPPSPRGRARRTASALASSSRSWTSCGPGGAGLLRTARGRRRGRRPPRRCAPRRRSRPAARGADLEHRDADAGVGAQRRAPRTAARRRRRSPGRARPSARRRAGRARASQSPASTTAWLPHETTVCRRRPRRAASALTATLPLCETTATWPASRGTSASPHSAARSWKATIPSQLGPQTGRSWRSAAARSARLQALAVGRLAEARRVDDGAAAPARAGLLDDLGHAGGGDRDDDRVDGLGQVGHGGHARAPVHAPARRVHAPHAPAEAERA